MNIQQLVGLVDVDNREWTPVERAVAVAILTKYANCVRARVVIPEPVFEANLLGNKSVNTDVAVIHTSKEGKRIYLSRRTSSEIFTGKLHLPGVTHRYESLLEATQRLLNTELSVFNFQIADLTPLGVLDLQDLPRGPVQSNLYLARIDSVPEGLEKDFYIASEIPWDDILVSHKTVTLPWLIKHDYL